MYIQVSNLDLNYKNEELAKLFSSIGEVSTAEIVIDQFTDQSRGFGFVEMPNEEEAIKAIEALNKSIVNDRSIIVEEAKPKPAQKGSYKVGNGAINVFNFKKT